VSWAFGDGSASPETAVEAQKRLAISAASSIVWTWPLSGASFGRRTGQTGFDPRADINMDGVVDIRDLYAVSSQLPAGTKCPSK